LFIADSLEILKFSKDENIDIILLTLKPKLKNLVIRRHENKIKSEKICIEKSNIIHTVGIDLTNGCNLDCKYCFISASLKEHKLLNKQKFLDLLNFLKKENNRSINFYFAGAGEPTLNFKLIKQLPRLCEENGMEKCIFHLTTNGTLLTQEMIDFFRESDFIINISLDGNKEINDFSRVYRDGKGSFDNVYSNIQLLRKNNVVFACKTVVL
jgi:sulfatase maturation enzyme AslB (radical SAM superfamily)